MRAFLKMISPAEAWLRLAAAVRPPDPWPAEEILVDDADGRVLAAAAFARVSAPSYHAAAMDGFAVRAAATSGASEARPLRLRRGDDAAAVDTGDPLPPGFDAVVRVEDVQEREGEIEIVAAAAPYAHVRLTGEDIVAGELVVPQGRRLTPFDLGALLQAGHARVLVRRRPRVAVLPTGDELVEPGTAPAPGRIVESNSRVLAALVARWGGEARRRPAAPDRLDSLEASCRAALLDADVLVVNAGSSAGRDDWTAAILGRLGELLFHGLGVMPGKPTAAAVTADGKAVLGLPGYPVSCVVAADRLLRPLLARLVGVAAEEREQITARVTRKLPSKAGHEEVVRVQVGRVADGYVVAPLPRGAGAVTTLSRANGLLVVPAHVEGHEPGDAVSVELLAPRAEIDSTLLHVGSHDLALDVLGDLLRRRHPGRALASTNAGSLAGLHALARGECHLAGCHLLDPESGDYNRPYVARACRGRAVALVALVEREQGLVVRRGNPKAITALADLARPDVVFVNRQRGAGTRVLLDARLRDLGLGAERVRGYEREEHTHTAAAVAVASGVADCALAIRAAAVALGLDFVPLEVERYELAVPAELLETPLLADLLETVRSGEFRSAAAALGGYGAAHSGEVR